MSDETDKPEQITCEQAAGRKQHNVPCRGCPFSRGVVPGALGGSSPLVYVGQANGPFLLPCHSTHDHEQLDARIMAAQTEGFACAGAAIFRANVGVDARLPKSFLRLPADKEKVFGSYAEFLSHHFGMPVEICEAFLRDHPVDKLTNIQLEASMAKVRAGQAILTVRRKDE